MMSKIKESIESYKLTSKVYKKEKDSASISEKRRLRRDNEKVTLINFTYDQDNDEYIYDEHTKVKRSEIPHSAVHVTGKRNTYFHTDLWDELVWPGEGQSAIHMYLWMINEKINPDTLSEKKKGTDLDWKKIAMYGAIGIAILLIAPRFIH